LVGCIKNRQLRFAAVRWPANKPDDKQQ